MKRKATAEENDTESSVQVKKKCLTRWQQHVKNFAQTDGESNVM